MPLDRLTQITSSGISSTSTITVSAIAGVITATSATVASNITINASGINAGIITATTLSVGSGVTISAGIITASSFRGDGSQLTGIAATTNVRTNSLVVSGVSTFTNLVVSAGSTSAPSISPSEDSNTGIFFPSADTVAFAEGGVESVRVDSSGYVGINTANPTDKLTVLGSIQIQQDSGSSNRIILRGQPSSSYRWNIDNFSTSNTFRIFREDDATAANGAQLAGITSTGLFQFNSGYGSVATSYGVRAWVRKNSGFDGLGNGIMGSANVTSLTQQATGRWTVNLTNAMPDTNYAVVATSFRNNSDSFENEDPTVRSTTTFTICLMNYTASRYDFGFSAVVIR